MGKNILISVLIPVVAAALVIGCDSKSSKDSERVSQQSAVTPEISAERKVKSNISGQFNLIPSKDPGPQPKNFNEVWGGLKKVEEVYFPSFVHESLPKDPSEIKEGGLKASDLKEKILYVQVKMQGRPLSFNVLYTDSKLFTGTVLHRAVAPEAYLKEVLFDPSSVGVAFNPKSRVMDRDLGFTSYLSKTGIAELIGYIQSESGAATGKTHTQLAKEAAEKGEHYKVLYHWAISFRAPLDGDDWKSIEYEKVKAYWALNFPTSRDRAKGELNWFIGEHGGTPEMQALQKTWEN